jgi:hypothetical protein
MRVASRCLDLGGLIVQERADAIRVAINGRHRSEAGPFEANIEATGSREERDDGKRSIWHADALGRSCRREYTLAALVTKGVNWLVTGRGGSDRIVRIGDCASAT